MLTGPSLCSDSFASTGPIEPSFSLSSFFCRAHTNTCSRVYPCPMPAGTLSKQQPASVSSATLHARAHLVDIDQGRRPGGREEGIDSVLILTTREQQQQQQEEGVRTRTVHSMSKRVSKPSPRTYVTAFSTKFSARPNASTICRTSSRRSLLMPWTRLGLGQNRGLKYLTGPVHLADDEAVAHVQRHGCSAGLRPVACAPVSLAGCQPRVLLPVSESSRSSYLLFARRGSVSQKLVMLSLSLPSRLLGQACPVPFELEFARTALYCCVWCTVGI